MRRALPLAIPVLLAAAHCGGSDSPDPPGDTTATSGTSTGGGGTSASTSQGPGSGGATSSSGGMGGSGGGSGGGGTGGSGGASAVVKIIAIGDTGEGNEGQHVVADRMSEKCIAVGGCHAVMMNGDNFYDHGVDGIDDAQWVAKFEQPYDRPGLNGVPFYAVLGNHDYGATSNGEMQAQIDYTFLPVGNGPGMRLTDKWNMPAAYYDVQVGDVHLFALDTQDFSTTDQRDDMAARVAQSTATWKIVFGHHPRYTSGEHQLDNPALGFAGMYDLQETVYCNTDMLMTGHDHDREFIEKSPSGGCTNRYFVISGAGAKLRAYDSFFPESGQLYYDDQVEGFAYMEFDGNTLHFEFIDAFGVVNFSKTITK